MSDEPTPRRTFIGQIALTTAGLAGAARAAAAAEPHTSLPAARRSPWDDSWTGRLGSVHRFVFDIADLSNAGMVLGQVRSLYDDYHTALDTRDQDMHMVVVVRHAAITMIFGDAIWAKYKLGVANTSKDSLTALQARGAIVLACNVATMNRVRNFARDSGEDEAAVEQEVRAGILPGVILQPNGVYALHRAQDAGCTLYHLG